MLSVAPTFFHLLYVAVAADPVIHLLAVGLLAAAQHRQRAPSLFYHVHDAVKKLQRQTVRMSAKKHNAIPIIFLYIYHYFFRFYRKTLKVKESE